jgi:TolB-like protein/Tfp pilus assembly protein PilF
MHSTSFLLQRHFSAQDSEPSSNIASGTSAIDAAPFGLLPSPEFVGGQMEVAHNNGRLRFGHFQVDLLSGELRKNGHKVRLQHQPFQLLAVLLERPGEIVTREEVSRRLWTSDTVVDFDHGLGTAVNKLREALGDSAESPRFVETLSRRGYRFIGKIDHVATEAIAGSSRFRPTTLAVLPFQNLSRDSSQDYFADGLTEEMIMRLGELGGSQLGVVARTSSMAYKQTAKDIGQIGRELDVDYLLESSVRRDGHQIRITVQLIRVQNQTLVWANSYDRELTHSIGVQEEVAREVARRIKVSLAPAGALPVPLNPLANDAYLQARHFFNQFTGDGFGKAASYFEKAVAADPSFAAAWAGIAASYTFQIITLVLRPQEGWPKVRHAAQKAIELDPALSDGRLNLAHFELHMWNWKSTERAFQKSLALNPSNAMAHRWYATYFLCLGRHQEAIREMNRSRELDPFSVITNAEVVRTLYYARRYEQAVEEAHKAELLDPDYPRTHFWLGRVYAQMGKFSEAIAEAERSGPTDSVIRLTELAYARARAGETAKANAVLQKLQQRAELAYVPAYDFAIVHTALGENEQALAWLQKAYTEHDWPLVVLGVEPRLDPLRSDSRFRSLLRKVGLKQP